MAGPVPPALRINTKNTKMPTGFYTVKAKVYKLHYFSAAEIAD